jgi:hypothetical protein
MPDDWLKTNARRLDSNVPAAAFLWTIETVFSIDLTVRADELK